MDLRQTNMPTIFCCSPYDMELLVVAIKQQIVLQSQLMTTERGHLKV